MKNQPEIEVGILLTDELEFLPGDDFLSDNVTMTPGQYKAAIKNNRISVSAPSGKTFVNDSFLFTPAGDYSSAFFELRNVTIGIGFHWEQKENQQFRGKLKLINEEGRIRAVNIIRLEDYLKSVISSEMSSTASPDFLKAHAIISRSWLLAQIGKNNSIESSGSGYATTNVSDDEVIRWYDREDHVNFDVCADDHCQRYHGITKILNDKAIAAVDETFGSVLMYEGKICDARFSKCCGGVTENFEYVWEPVRHRYLTKIVDSDRGDTTCVDLRNEDEAERWIKNSPPAFCNTTDRKVLSQVLPGFDQKTSDFYRWNITYSQQELSELLTRKSGYDFGNILKLEAVKRGHSGRIVKLKITGTKKTVVVGKELEIRKWLSESHLYSSAFVVEYLDLMRGVPQKFVISGAGWGHGVGLCQIGAAVMGEKGHPYQKILSHYFSEAKLQKAY